MFDEMGIIDVVEIQEIGGDWVMVFRQEDEVMRIVIIVFCGVIQNYFDDIECVVDDGVNVVKVIIRDVRLVFGVGVIEIEFVERIQVVGDKIQGFVQYFIKKYVEVFEVVLRIFVESVGLDVIEVLSRLYVVYQKQDGWFVGVDIEVCFFCFFCYSYN